MSPVTPPIGAAEAERDYLRRFVLAPWYRRKLRRMRAKTKRSGDRYVPVTLLNGMSMLINPQEFLGNRIIRQGTYSYEFIFLIGAIARAIGRTGTIIDGGANIGNHSLHFATIFDRVLAFEPNPHFVSILNQNLARNHITNVTVCPVGLSSENTSLPYMFSDPLNPAASRFMAKDAANADEVLEVRRGDEVVTEQGVGRIDAIKLDVEGHEVEALLGLRETLKRDRPFLLFEYLPSYMESKGGFGPLADALSDYIILRPEFPHKRKPFGRYAALLRGLEAELVATSDHPDEYIDLVAISREDFERLPHTGPLRVVGAA